MPVHPQCQVLLDAAAASPVRMVDLEVDAARRVGDAGLSIGATTAPPVALGSVVDTTMPGPAGEIPLRVYTPVGDDTARPGVVFIHGGGFVIGSLATHDPICRLLAAAADAVVVAVDYRLAPEHPFPAAVDDSFAALQWVAVNAADLGIDPARLAVAGDSAGGNLSAVVCQLARDAGGPAVAFQALMYPAVDADRAGYPSVTENASGYFLEAETMDWFQRHYVPDPSTVDVDDVRLSPLRATSLAGLPPAIVITAEFDPLRDEGEAYAAALAAAGVPVEQRRHDGMIHGFWNFIGMIDAATEATIEIAEAMGRVVR